MIAVALGQAAPKSGSVTEQQWQMWIDEALMLIEIRKDELGRTDAIDEARLDYVVRQAVVAQVKRPDDSTQVTIRVDDASTSKSYRSSKGRVTILDEWWALLGLSPTGGQAFAIDTLSVGSTHAPWCSLAFGANYCDCGADIAGFPLYGMP
ncbi:MAG TPA: hypothetical protein VFL73_10570 [Solirubrobacteraceae bacterium]|nr:hypothetical protein [Solirubrobacteraceae bacterium]